MAVYEKDKRFSPGWMLGGAVLMIITWLFGGFVATAVGVVDLWIHIGVSLGCFAFTGFVIGWQSEGRTIIEAGLAAVLAIAGVLALRDGFRVDPIILAITSAVPFVAAIIGAVIGEAVQGNEIHTQD